jgi:hypothetical protein
LLTVDDVIPVHGCDGLVEWGETGGSPREGVRFDTGLTGTSQLLEPAKITPSGKGFLR